jgi:predicted metal-binding protein
VSRKVKVTPGDIVPIETGWRETILICRKCGKRLGGGFGKDGKATLRAALRQELRKHGRRRSVRLIETGCFGICPKKGVTVGLGSAAGELLVVGKGAELSRLLDRWKLMNGAKE